MGFFSNGTEGDMYQSQFCARCINWKDVGDGRGAGCPVWDLHMLYNYDQHKKASTEAALAMFIPRDAAGWNRQCAMFHERGKNGGGQPEPLPVLLTIVKAA